MYYSNSNYEAFARPRTPEGVETRSAYLVGGGLASLAAAAFLVRDAGMPGERITILEASKVPGGSLDGAGDAQTGWMIRGGREMEEQFQCLWDLFRSIPSLTIEGASVLDEYHRLDKDDPSFAPVRATHQQGVPLPDRHLLTIDRRSRTDLILLVLAKEESLDGKTIEDVFSHSFFRSNFWLFWRSMFAFEQWHSAIEMRRYLMRFIHHIVGLTDLRTLKFAKYNQYESMVRPLETWLAEQGVVFQYDTKVTNVELEIDGDRKIARKVSWLRDGATGGADLTERDLVIVTNGSMVENSTWGDHHTPAPMNTTVGEGSIWALWRNLASQDASFGRPDVFCTTPEETNWESATITTLDERIPLAMEKVLGRSVRSGRIGTGGPVTVKDSSWLLSWVVSRQPHFPNQPSNQVVAWLYGLFSDRPGDYVHKPMRECTGEEITKEWLFHLGVPVDEIDGVAATGAITRPCMMPFITSQFAKRSTGDRPRVVPAQCVNLAFVGQFAETPSDTVFTTEYSVRTAMEAVYTLLNIERGVPEPYPSIYDVRALLTAAAVLRDGAKLPVPPLVRGWIGGTILEDLLQQVKLV